MGGVGWTGHGGGLSIVVVVGSEDTIAHILPAYAPFTSTLACGGEPFACPSLGRSCHRPFTHSDSFLAVLDAFLG